MDTIYVISNDDYELALFIVTVDKRKVKSAVLLHSTTNFTEFDKKAFKSGRYKDIFKKQSEAITVYNRLLENEIMLLAARLDRFCNCGKIALLQ